MSLVVFLLRHKDKRVFVLFPVAQSQRSILVKSFDDKYWNPHHSQDMEQGDGCRSRWFVGMNHVFIRLRIFIPVTNLGVPLSISRRIGLKYYKYFWPCVAMESLQSCRRQRSKQWMQWERARWRVSRTWDRRERQSKMHCGRQSSIAFRWSTLPSQTSSE